MVPSFDDRRELGPMEPGTTIVEQTVIQEARIAIASYRKRFPLADYDADDMFQELFLVGMRCATRFDESLGIQLKTYLSTRVKFAAVDWYNKQTKEKRRHVVFDDMPSLSFCPVGLAISNELARTTRKKHRCARCHRSEGKVEFRPRKGVASGLRSNCTKCSSKLAAAAYKNLKARRSKNASEVLSR